MTSCYCCVAMVIACWKGITYKSPFRYMEHLTYLWLQFFFWNRYRYHHQRRFRCHYFCILQSHIWTSCVFFLSCFFLFPFSCTKKPNIRQALMNLLMLKCLLIETIKVGLIRRGIFQLPVSYKCFYLFLLLASNRAFERHQSSLPQNARPLPVPPPPNTTAADTFNRISEPV